MKRKWCDVGSHEVEKLFHSRKKDRPSCCPLHAPRTPIKNKVPISISGGEYSINGGKLSSKDGHVKSGDIITVNRRAGETKKPNADKSVAELKKLAQIVVNRFIRLKYAHSDGTTRCYTCLRWVSSKQIDASHFISVKHQSTRFDLNNLRACCTDCNRLNYGNLKRFRQHLVEEIGESAVEELEMRSKDIKHWTKQELLDIIEKFK